MTSIFTTDLDDRITKNIPAIQMDRVHDRMKTFVMNRKTINPVYLKRRIDDDCISTFPLRRSDGSFL
jgi:hypothetical protein